MEKPIRLAKYTVEIQNSLILVVLKHLVLVSDFSWHILCTLWRSVYPLALLPIYISTVEIHRKIWVYNPSLQTRFSRILIWKLSILWMSKNTNMNYIKGMVGNQRNLSWQWSHKVNNNIQKHTTNTKVVIQAGKKMTATRFRNQSN